MTTTWKVPSCILSSGTRTVTSFTGQFPRVISLRRIILYYELLSYTMKYLIYELYSSFILFDLINIESGIKNLSCLYINQTSEMYIFLVQIHASGQKKNDSIQPERSVHRCEYRNLHNKKIIEALAATRGLSGSYILLIIHAKLCSPAGKHFYFSLYKILGKICS